MVYDIKYLMKSCKTLKGGLQEVADDLQARLRPAHCINTLMSLQVTRIGPQHQAGSDSLLTGLAFFRMRDVRYIHCISLGHVTVG